MDVILIFIELMKLMIRSRENETISRRLERKQQLIHVDEVVKNFKDQANWLFGAGLGGGLLGIASGIIPIVGHTSSGGWLFSKLQNSFNTFKGLKQGEFFKRIAKMTFSMSQMQRDMGEVRKAFAEGNRFNDQQRADMRHSDSEDNTRAMEEMKQDFRSMLNVINEIMQMDRDTMSMVNRL